jgi:hypothetical protein
MTERKSSTPPAKNPDQVNPDDLEQYVQSKIDEALKNA